MTIGEKLREIRESKGMTQEQVGNLTNMTRQRVQAIEDGDGYPLMKTIISFSQALRCPLRDILNEPLELHLAAPDPLKDTDCPCENAEGCMFFKKKE